MDEGRESIEIGLRQVLARIEQAARKAGRPSGAVRLVAAAKTIPPERIQVALDQGLAAIGENRVQEAQEKFPRLKGRFERHLIGHLQSNKAGAALELFDWVQSVDSLSLSRRLSRLCEEHGRSLSVLWEVNTSGEPAKFGFEPRALLEQASELAALPALDPRGLMTLGPVPESGRDPRPCFRALLELRDALETRLGRKLPELSMGMSGDFEAAVEEGSTIVRVGSAIFGARKG